MSMPGLLDRLLRTLRCRSRQNLKRAPRCQSPLVAGAERASVAGQPVEGELLTWSSAFAPFLSCSLILRFSTKQAPLNVSLFDILRQIYVAIPVRRVSDLVLLRQLSPTKTTEPFSGRKERIITRDPFALGVELGVGALMS